METSSVSGTVSGWRSGINWTATAVLFLMGADAFVYGFSFPYFSLSLHLLGLSSGVVGLNSSLAGVGILLVGPFLPRLIARFGLKVVVITQYATATACFMILLGSQSVVVWFGTRLVLGAVEASIWTTTEIWLNAVVSDRHRGRIFGISGTFNALCQCAGPFVLAGVGVAGQSAVLAALIPLAAGLVVAVLVRSVARSAVAGDEPGKGALRTSYQMARPLLVAAFVTGFGEASMQGLLPLYGLSYGLSDAASARLVAAFSIGEAVLVVVLGWLADRYDQNKILAGTMLIAAIATATLPLVGGSIAGLWALVFLVGGTIPGIYTLLTILIGRNFTGAELSRVAVGFTIAYSAGSSLGPTPVGLLMRALGAAALPGCISVIFFVTAGWMLRLVRGTDRSAS